MSRAMGDKSLADLVSPGELLPILQSKANKSRVKVNALIVDLAAEMADQRRQQAGAAVREARRARLADAGVLKTPPGR